MLKSHVTYSNAFNMFFVIGFIYLLFNLGTSYLFVDKLQIVTIYILNLAPIIYYLKFEDKEELLPLFQMILIYIFIAYTLTFFFRNLEFYLFYFPSQSDWLTEEKIPILRSTRNILLIALLSLNLGYFFFLKFFTKKRQGFDSMLFKKNNTIVITGFLSFAAYILIFIILKLQNFIPGIGQMNYPLMYISFIMILTGALKNKNNIFINCLGVIFFCFIIYYNISLGIYGAPFKLITILFILFIFLKKRVPIFSIIIVVILFLFAHSIKYDIRESIISQGSSLDRKTTLTAIIKNKFFNKATEKKSRIELIKNNQLELRRTLLRVVHSYKSLLIINNEHHFIKTKTPSPYLNGSTYRILLTRLIPRIFWKDKPSDELGNSLGKYYSVLTQNDFGTSWNMPVINESYSNFGLKGVIVIMFLLGAISRYLSFNFFISKTYNVEFIISFTLILPLWYMESHLSQLIGGIIQQYLLLCIVFFLYLRVLKLLNSQSK